MHKNSTNEEQTIDVSFYNKDIYIKKKDKNDEG